MMNFHDVLVLPMNQTAILAACHRRPFAGQPGHGERRRGVADVAGIQYVPG